MSDLASKFVLSFGKHASATDFSTVPSLTHLMPEKHGFMSPDTVKLRRSPAHPQNKRFPALRGPIDIGKAISLEQIVTGLSGNNGGAIAALTANADIAGILDVVMGTASIDPSGAVDAATGGTGASKLLGVNEQARYPVGTVVLFTVNSGTPIVRQVRSRAGSSGAGNLTLDRTFSGTVDVANIVRCARWVCDPAVYEHVHATFRGEYDNDMRTYIAGMSRWSLDFSLGQYGKLMTSWMFTNITDAAEANPSFSEPARGSGLVNVNNSFFLGDDVYYADDIKVEADGSMVERKANVGPQGRLGFTVQKGGDTPPVRISVKLKRGVNTGEVADSTGNTSQNKLQAWDKALGDPLAVFDLAFHVGTAAGAIGYGVAQNAMCMKADEIIVDGYKHLDCEFECTTPTNTSLYPFEFHLG